MPHTHGNHETQGIFSLLKISVRLREVLRFKKLHKVYFGSRLRFT